MSSDVHTLTGAYVLDALSEVERKAFEEHMGACPSCHQEVAELRETTARLGTATAEIPPPELWDKVRAATANARQLPPPTGDNVVQLRSRRWPARIAALAAAVSVLAAVGVGVVLTRSNNQLEDQLAQSRSQFDQLRGVLEAPDAKFASGQAPGGGSAMAVVAPSRNAMLFMTRGLQAPPPGHVFQIWYMHDHGQKSAGLINSATGSVITDLSAAAGAETLGVSIEPAGGSAVPSKDSVVTTFKMPV